MPKSPEKTPRDATRLPNTVLLNINPLSTTIAIAITEKPRESPMSAEKVAETDHSWMAKRAGMPPPGRADLTVP